MKAKISNPLAVFHIIRYVWRARRPSTLADMPAVVDTFWLRRGYDALTFFGVIVTPSQQEADMMNATHGGSGHRQADGGGTAAAAARIVREAAALKRHEMIHLRQAQATGDSWWRFYRLYLRYWLPGWRQRRHHPNAGYRLNPFEMEAYRHMYDPQYLDRCRDGANGWRRYAALSVDERAALYESTRTRGR